MPDWRDADDERVQAVVEVLAEEAEAHHRREVAVGRDDESHVDRPRALGANRTYFPSLEDP